MQDTPRDTELLAAVAEFLRRDVVPALDGSLQFQTRVAANVVDRVLRELEQPAAQAEEEQQRLESLLHLGGDIPTLTQVLCDRIAAGEITIKTPGLTDFLWWVTRNKLRVDQPRYAGYRRALERSPADAPPDA
ncbi:hypothetical protein SADO_06237 [Salinisphaera dokdonensis CL-ES53]|uniref:DUF6285 domain-containing protein n=1 Tax=Salinisphaera dokdonensis CL-ES53 TaxID=1304272 RepID=A0ABV2AZT8_9GAMM